MNPPPLHNNPVFWDNYPAARWMVIAIKSPPHESGHLSNRRGYLEGLQNVDLKSNIEIQAMMSLYPVFFVTPQPSADIQTFPPPVSDWSETKWKGSNVSQNRLSLPDGRNTGTEVRGGGSDIPWFGNGI